METEKTLTERIMAITLEIQENYPELSKYVSEMTETIPNENYPDINSKKLKEYYDSLTAMVKKYKEEHILQENEKMKG